MIAPQNTRSMKFNPAVQHQMAAVMGVGKTPRPVSPTDMTKIRTQMFRLFIGLALGNWLRGGSLGAAWYAALGQMDSYLAPKGKLNPAVAYMRKCFAEYRTYVARHTMTHPNRELGLECDDKMRAQLTTISNTMTRSGLNTLNATFSAYASQNNDFDLRASMPHIMRPQKVM